MESRELSGIEEIYIKGNANVSVKNNKLFVNDSENIDPDNIKIQGSKLTIEGYSNSITFGNNRGVVNFGNGNYNNVMTIGNGTSNMVISNGSTSTVYINGVKVDLNKLKELESKEDEIEKEKFKYLFTDSLITNIVVKGSGTFSCDKDFISDSVSLSLSGSGDIFVPKKEYKSINVNLTGSGDIKGNNSNVEMLNVNLCGSGYVKKFHILTTGMLNLTGSGDIRVSKKNGANVNKNKLGSGSIKVN